MFLAAANRSGQYLSILNCTVRKGFIETVTLELCLVGPHKKLYHFRTTNNSIHLDSMRRFIVGRYSTSAEWNLANCEYTL